MDDEDIPDLVEVQDQPGPSRTASPRSLAAGPSADTYERRKVPMTILTGYLGAGKSTLLDYILKEQHGYKIAVCMNDFGDSTDIEAKSLTFTDPSTGSQSSQFLSLPNGCLCCSFKDMGIAAIEEMAHQEGVEWVMVELTGLADPGPIIRGFWENEEMGDLVLDGVICVVDCRNVLNQLSEARESGEVNEAQKQVACADVILLNKTDLVDPSQLERVEATIRDINPTLRIHRTKHSRTPLSDLFDLRAYTAAPLPSPTRDPDRSDHDRAHDHDHDHAHAPSTGPDRAVGATPHFGRISTITVPLPALTAEQYDRLQRFLEDTLWVDLLSQPQPPAPAPAPGGAVSDIATAAPADMGVSTTSTAVAEPYSAPMSAPASKREREILRTKGIIRLVDGREYILQGVTDVFELKEVPRPSDTASDPDADAAGGKVVFIGRGVGEMLRDELKAAVGIP